MTFKYFITNALKGQYHQHRATPCDWRDEQFQALQGRHQVSFRITPLQGLNLRMYPFHRTLPDVNAKRLSALILVISCLFFIPKRLFKNFSIIKIRRKAYNVNNHVCNAGLTSHSHSALLRMELNYVVPYNHKPII